jgi:hypothetical protein
VKGHRRRGSLTGMSGLVVGLGLLVRRIGINTAAYVVAVVGVSRFRLTRHG